MNRRLFLGSSACMLTSLTSLGLFSSREVFADNAAQPFKALVCIFLYGGNDGMNMIVPTDTTRYDLYAKARGALAIPKDLLIPFKQNFGLHPALNALKPAMDDTSLAALFNVGPLAVSNKQEPDNLFSHSHQQRLWECGGSSNLISQGWGGRFAETQNNVVISTAGNRRFGLTDQQGNLALPGEPNRFNQPGNPKDPRELARQNATEALSKLKQNNLLRQEYDKVAKETFNRIQTLGGIVSANLDETPANPLIDKNIRDAFSTVYKNGSFDSPLSAQLFQIAKLLANRSAVGGNRQIYFASLDGFDTHANQIQSNSAHLGKHADLLSNLSKAVAAFYAAMKALNLHHNVTTFTASDFGRTLKPNNSLGSDHGWGNTQLIIGGGVSQGVFGTYPNLELGGKDDHDDAGRWIPTTSVDEYAATLGHWFGVSDAQLSTIFPSLRDPNDAKKIKSLKLKFLG